MNDEDIERLADELNIEASKTNRAIKIVQHGGGPDESYIVATRAGYLSLAALFLQASIAPFKDGSTTVDVETEDVIHEDSDVFINWFERDETLQTPQYVPHQMTLKEITFGALASIGCFVFVIAIIGLIGVGLSTVTSTWFG